jgi:hypothetical protein
MTTVDQFLKALAVVESKDNPEAWGDGGQAMGRWQVHPARLWVEMHGNIVNPTLTETWDQLVARVLRNIWSKYAATREPVAIAMYWHLGHFCESTAPEWDLKYAARFGAALMNAEEELP